MAARPPSALSLSAPLLERARRDSPSHSPTRDRRKNMSTYESQPWAVSPSATLQAFTDGIDPSATPEAQQLLSGISNVTTAEKDLGARVASATKKIKDWCAELEAWTWCDTFEPPLHRDPYAQEKDTQGFNKDAAGTDNDDESAYWGSLPASTVMAYGVRLDTIKEELEDLNMDELKGYILDMYPMERPRPTSGYGNKRAELHLLDDFSYVVTHTMLQALPCLSYLSQLTRVWSVRLLVLQEVPHFLTGLDDVMKAMRLGWNALDLPDDPQNSTKELDGWKEDITKTRDNLQSKITSLGRKLDRMLDALEGMNDVLPDNWIDDFEAVETDYSKWAADAQKRIFELDMLMSRPPEKLTRPTSARGADQPFGFGALHTPRKSHLAVDNGEHRLLSDADDKLAPVPKLNRTSTTFSPHKSGHIIERGHQRSRSRSEPDFHVSPFKFAQRLETIEGTPTKPDRFRTFDLDAEQVDSDDSEAIAESSIHESVERRASVTSLESQVKGVDARRDSNSSSKQEPQSNNSSPRRRHSHSGGPLATTEEEEFSSISSDGYAPMMDTPELRIEGDSSSPAESQLSSPVGSPNDSPSLRVLPGKRNPMMPRPPLNSAMHKRRTKSQQVPIVIPSDSDSDNESRDSPGPRPRKISAVKGKAHRRVSSATADLEQQIRRLITSVHAPIRLTSGDAEASPVGASSKRAFSDSRPPSSLRVSRKSSIQSITMSAVVSEQDRHRHARYGNSDIKLYHLMQPGQAKPIKLFVRRVGENGERLMVRVGGGWADLGEYLRQYADHHSRRVISEGKVESLGYGDSPEPLRPTSSHSNVGGSKQFLGTPPTSAPRPRSRPGSAMSNYSSFDRDDSGAMDSGASQKSWAGNEVGLAGPKTKKLDLSGEKLEWIEGMMNQAKMLGAQQAANTRKLYMKHGGHQQ
ncbi:hypothetical protein BFW01_g4697 [Lasiodiplodia theobromae]|uniref:GAR domain-containing protein n=1 Tax=Lasiodiplodia theobromae TaxID=45133 RepID=A0A5N5DUC9_9PEZI|nr:Gas2 domain-containing protein [Lasiodiplodia theobromae]KAB2579814.1 hypothetical protein DBV05_g1601 [Lasiodiplodia theobromae]KAF4542998.1 Gas2 domain-containing protein [Lasiodiplodia theobromae]KAF9633803.1 hypothetical protein BFW01_g4697 [Lasiodiplodia theobromae]